MDNSLKNSSEYSLLEMESKDEHNKRSADSSEKVSEYQFGTNGYFGPQLKNLSNALKIFGQQLELSSESLKNAAPSELEFSMHPGETKKSNKYWFLDFLMKKLIFIQILAKNRYWRKFLNKKLQRIFLPQFQTLLIF